MQCQISQLYVRKKHDATVATYMTYIYISARILHDLLHWLFFLGGGGGQSAPPPPSYTPQLSILIHEMSNDNSVFLTFNAMAEDHGMRH